VRGVTLCCCVQRVTRLLDGDCVDPPPWIIADVAMSSGALGWLLHVEGLQLSRRVDFDSGIVHCRSTGLYEARSFPN